MFAESDHSRPTSQPGEATTNPASGSGGDSPSRAETSTTPPSTHASHSAGISASDRDAIFNAIRSIREKLDALGQSPGNVEEGTFAKMGKQGLAFIEKARSVAESKSDLLPRSFDIDNFSRDALLLETLRSISAELQKLTHQVEAAESAAGSSAFISALAVHEAVRFARGGLGIGDLLAGGTPPDSSLTDTA